MGLVINHYGKPKKEYFIHIRNGEIITNKVAMNVSDGDIVSIVYIKWMILKTESKRVAFFLNDKSCDITNDIFIILLEKAFF